MPCLPWKKKRRSAFDHYDKDIPMTCWDKVKLYLCCIRPHRRVLRWRSPPEDKSDQTPVVTKSVKKKTKKQMQDEMATRIQKIIRGVLGRKKALLEFSRVAAIAFDYWNTLRDQREAAAQKRKDEKMTRNKFVLTYVGNLLDTSAMFLIQTAAVRDIQRLWRGYFWRSRHPRPPKKRPPPPRRPPRLRFGPDVYRRMWARSFFVPKGGWPGRIDYIPYDVWDHTDKPPKGPDFGLRVKKYTFESKDEPLSGNATVESIAITESYYSNNGAPRGTIQALAFDKNAWVGLPVYVETSTQRSQFKLAARSKMEKILATASPYLTNVVNLADDPTLLSKNNKNNRNFDNSYNITQLNTFKTVDEKMEILGWNRSMIKEQDAKKKGLVSNLEGLWNAVKSRSLFNDDIHNLEVVEAIFNGEKNLSQLINLPFDVIKPDIEQNIDTSIQDISNDIVRQQKPSILLDEESKDGHVNNGDFNRSNQVNASFQRSDSTANQSVASQHDDSEYDRLTKLTSKFVSMRQDTPLRGSFKPNSLYHTRNAIMATHLATMGTADALPIDDDHKPPGLIDSRPALPPGTQDRLYQTFVQGKLEDASLLSRTSYRPENPDLQFSMDPNMLPYDPFEKSRTMTKSFGTKSLPNNRLTGAKDDPSIWKQSAWGRMKQKTATMLQQQPEVLSSFLDESLNDDIDSQVWSRAVFRPKKVVRSRVRIWPVKPREHYTLRYTWLPQQYVSNAVSHLYAQKIGDQSSTFVTAIDENSLNKDIRSASRLDQKSFLTVTETSTLSNDQSHSIALPQEPSITDSAQNSSIIGLDDSESISQKPFFASTLASIADESNDFEDRETLEGSLSKGLRAIDRSGSIVDSIDSKRREKKKAEKELAKLHTIVKLETHRRRYGSEDLLFLEQDSINSSAAKLHEKDNKRRSTEKNSLVISNSDHQLQSPSIISFDDNSFFTQGPAALLSPPYNRKRVASNSYLGASQRSVSDHNLDNNNVKYSSIPSIDSQLNGEKRSNSQQFKEFYHNIHDYYSDKNKKYKEVLERQNNESPSKRAENKAWY